MLMAPPWLLAFVDDGNPFPPLALLLRREEQSPFVTSGAIPRHIPDRRAQIAARLDVDVLGRSFLIQRNFGEPDLQDPPFSRLAWSLRWGSSDLMDLVGRPRPSPIGLILEISMFSA